MDNYTTTEPSRPLTVTANTWYKTEPETLYSSTVIVLTQETNLNKRIHKLLNEYALLQDNWDEDNAIAPDGQAIANARYISNLLESHGQPVFHAAPGPNGEVMLDIRNKRKNKSFEIIFYSTRSIIVTFPETEKPVQKNFELHDLPIYLQWLNSK